MIWLAKVRGGAAIWLIGLILSLSSAPCTASAAPVQGVVASSHDPCRDVAVAPALACLQLACQAALEPSAPSETRANRSAPVRYQLVGFDGFGLDVPPTDPPPRLR